MILFKFLTLWTIPTITIRIANRFYHRKHSVNLKGAQNDIDFICPIALYRRLGRSLIFGCRLVDSNPYPVEDLSTQILLSRRLISSSIQIFTESTAYRLVNRIAKMMKVNFFKG